MAEIKVSIDDVRFEAGKLWKPRYNNLINYRHAPRGFQFEPAFMLRSAALGEEAEVQAVFTIAADEKVAFDVLPAGRVRWMLLSNPHPEPFVEVTVLDPPENRTCQVVWKRTGARLAALRICCRYTEGGPAAYSDEWAWSVVEGGVYLVIIDPGAALPEPTRAQKDAETPWPDTVRLLGIDEHYRPVYDLFCGTVPGENVRPELVPEPAFRAHPGAQLPFKIALDLPDSPYGDVRFQEDEDGQAKMDYAVPATRPSSLQSARVAKEGKECTIQWNRLFPGSCTTGSAAAMTDPCREWSTSNFYAEVGFANQNTAIRIDPTVIEPPACDASGVCGPPRGYDD